MQELIQKLKDNAGLTDEQAMKAVSTMKELISGKVPPMFSGFVDNFFADTSAGSDDTYMH